MITWPMNDAREWAVIYQGGYYHLYSNFDIAAWRSLTNPDIFRWSPSFRDSLVNQGGFHMIKINADLVRIKLIRLILLNVH